MVDKNNNFMLRLNDFTKKLKENDIKNVILNDNLSLRYFLGLKILSDFYLIITESSSNDKKSKNYGTIIVPLLEYHQVKDQLVDFPLDVLTYGDDFKLSDAFVKLNHLYNINNNTVGLYYDSLKLSDFNQLSKNQIFQNPALNPTLNPVINAALNPVINPTLNTAIKSKEKQLDSHPNFALIDSDKIIDAGVIINEMREIKYPDEIEKIRKAAEIGDKAMQKGIDSLKDGITESEISAIIEYEMMKLGSEDRSFDTIVASGSNSWYPHAIHTEKKIKDGEVVTIDMGAVYKGYHSDLTRTVFVGEGPYNNELVNIINVVNDTQKKAIELLKPGRKCHDIDLAARNYLKEKGILKYFIHGLGHGVGLDVHDPVPRLAPNIDYLLRPGMVVTVEPGVYIPGLGGTRTEDLLVITEDGYDYLSHAPVKYY